MHHRRRGRVRLECDCEIWQGWHPFVTGGSVHPAVAWLFGSWILFCETELEKLLSKHMKARP
eukprot:2729101-Amphidinium_carterae.1